jgi:3-hydroxybutyrate dehydrogenase
VQLEGKVAFVTGAGQGIGASVAQAYAREGAKVAIADLNQEAADAAAKEIRAAQGVAMGVAMDVGDEKAVNDGVAAVVAEFGGVDILVSNAGIQIVHPIEAFPFADWKKLLAIHLDGAFLTTKACLPHMYRAGRGGSIIYMGSVHSKEASLLKSAYVTAKHGLIGLTTSVSAELASRGIRVNLVCPGFVDTPMHRRARAVIGDEVYEKAVLPTVHLRRAGRPEEIARSILFLCSDEASYITGTTLTPDGGYTLTV